jgi:hypothetical protein
MMENVQEMELSDGLQGAVKELLHTEVEHALGHRDLSKRNTSWDYSPVHTLWIRTHAPSAPHSHGLNDFVLATTENNGYVHLAEYFLNPEGRLVQERPELTQSSTSLRVYKASILQANGTFHKKPFLDLPAFDEKERYGAVQQAFVYVREALQTRGIDLAPVILNDMGLKR